MARPASRFTQRSSRPKKPKAPLPVSFEATISHIGGRGDGVARLGDDAVFIPFTVPGDQVMARVDGKKGDGLSAQLVELLAQGPDRQAPICPHFGTCGGCATQHVSPDLYDQWKTGLLTSQLKRLGLDAPVQPLQKVALGTRRRASFAFKRIKAGTVLGFNARASHQIIDLDTCPLLVPEVLAILPDLRQIIGQIVKDDEGDCLVTQTDGGLDVVINGDARLDLFDREALAQFAEQHDLARLSLARPGHTPEIIARRRAAITHFAGVAVELAPGGFLQPTRQGEHLIRDLVLDATKGAKRVADLYSGCGSFSLPLAKQAEIVAAEGEEGPVKALQAAANGAKLNVKAEIRDLSRRPFMAPDLKKLDALVFDPPRAGALAQAEQLAAHGPKIVVAVSCNPSTMARDLKVLVDGGYVIKSVTPIDQFLFSPHVEAVAILIRD